jgi:hypothetical protein
MPTVRCDYDDGDCNWDDGSDRVLLLSGGQLSVLTTATAERMFTVDEGAKFRPLELPAEVPFAAIVDAVLEARRTQSPLDGSFDGTSGSRAAARVRELEERLRADADDEDLIIVNCEPCGHVYGAPVTQ